jgi:hypothetical protein
MIEDPFVRSIVKESLCKLNEHCLFHSDKWSMLPATWKFAAEHSAQPTSGILRR